MILIENLLKNNQQISSEEWDLKNICCEELYELSFFGWYKKKEDLGHVFVFMCKLLFRDTLKPWILAPSKNSFF